jgi:hypothetical protein
MLFFSRSYQTAGGGDKPILSPKPRHSWRNTFFTPWHDWVGNFSFFGCDHTNGTYTRQADRLLGYNGTVLYTFLQQHYKTRHSHTFFASYTLQTTKKKTDKNDRNYDRLWKMWDMFEMISNACMKYYNPSEHLAVDKVIDLFNGRAVFKQSPPPPPKKKKASKFSNCVIWPGTLATWRYIWERTDNAWHQM